MPQYHCKLVLTQDKTTKASFRQTVSSFKESSLNWNKIVQENKSAIYAKDESDKDKIMNTHTDMTLRNCNSFKVREQLGSMRGKAEKVSKEYL